MTSEIISTVERRRQWPTEEKVRVMSEALAPGATIAAVADRNGVCRSQLYAWLRLAREGKLRGISMSAPGAVSFVPVRIAADTPTSSPTPPCDPPASPVTSSRAPASSTLRGRRPAMVEVVLTNGRIVKVDECIDPDALARLLAVVEYLTSGSTPNFRMGGESHCRRGCQATCVLLLDPRISCSDGSTMSVWKRRLVIRWEDYQRIQRNPRCLERRCVSSA